MQRHHHRKFGSWVQFQGALLPQQLSENQETPSENAMKRCTKVRTSSRTKCGESCAGSRALSLHCAHLDHVYRGTPALVESPELTPARNPSAVPVPGPDGRQASQ